MNFCTKYIKQINENYLEDNLFNLYLEIYEIYLENIANIKRFFPNITQEDVDEISKLDPTSEKRYTKWLLLRAKSNKEPKYFSLIQTDGETKIEFGEDAYKVEEYLTIYNKARNKPDFKGKKDIEQYKTVASLYEDIKDIKREDVSQSKTELLDSDEVDKIYEDNSWLMISPKTWEASCKFGKGTEWCTASGKRRNFYDEYTSKGPLYILIDKKDKTNKYQFQFYEGALLADKDDNEIKPLFWIKENNIPEGLLNKLNELDPEKRFVDVDTLSGEEKIKAVMNNYNVTKYTINDDGSINIHQNLAI